MASTIQAQTVGGVAEQCIALAASQFGRLHGYGNDWTTLRIALLWAVEDSGVNIAGSVLRVALCNGTADMPGDATTNNSFGMKQQAAWTRTGSGSTAFYTPPAPWAFTRVGSTESTSLLGNGLVVGTVSYNRSLFFLDVTKGSPNYTLQFFGRSDDTHAGDITPATFLTTIGQVTPAATYHAYNTPSGNALAVNVGTNGILDTVYVGWNLLSPRLFISNLAVVRLA